MIAQVVQPLDKHTHIRSYVATVQDIIPFQKFETPQLANANS